MSNRKSRHSLVLCGGGVDTYVAAWDNQQRHPSERTVLLYINYGAKATSQEIRATRELSNAMNARFMNSTEVLRISTDFWSNNLSSSLTGDGVVNQNPTVGVAHEWVPARNTVLMAMALAIADNGNFARIVCGINRTAAIAYPDNSMAWLSAYQELAYHAVNSDKIELEAPVGHLEKYQIINHAFGTGMTQEILEHSWSCYNGGEIHCGECSSCRARKEAFRRSVWNDPTKYKVA